MHEFIRRYFDGENVGKGEPEECMEDEHIEDGIFLFFQLAYFSISGKRILYLHNP